MQVAIEKEQLKAVIRQAMISVLEDDVYGTSDPAAASDFLTTYPQDPDHSTATPFPPIASGSVRPRLWRVAAMRSID
jgi:hypothetical protein